MTQINGSHFELIKKIGGGSFGQIYIGEDTQNHKKVAVKLENKKTSVPQLCYESKLYVLFSGCPSVPRFHWFGTDNTHNIMVIDLLGKSLEDLFVQCGQKITLKSVLMLADQMISCVEYIHSKNFIHNDIKPDNFVMGKDDKANQVHVIDFGLSKKYRDPYTHQHIRYADGRSLTGTPRYASIRALEGVRQTRRDDMESLGYVWMYLLRGSLPWMGINLRSRTQKFDRILEVKKSTPIESLCDGYPAEFAEYLHDVRNLKFDEQPNYNLYRKRFRDLFIRKGYVFDYVYDWTDVSKIRRRTTSVHAEQNAKNEQQHQQTHITRVPSKQRYEVNKKAQKEEHKENKEEIKKEEKQPQFVRAPPIPESGVKAGIDINNLPTGGPLPNGPFPRPMWRSRFPRWMTAVKSLQIE